MSDEQDGCEWVNISSSTGLSVKWLCVRACVCVCVCADWETSGSMLSTLAS